MSRRSKKYKVTEGSGYGCWHDVTKQLYSSAEVLIPGKFSSNGRWQDEDEQIPVQYLHHCTHSKEKDIIWDGETANFKGFPKFARMRVLTQYCCVQSWKAADYTSLEQLRISNCGKCTEGEHKCGDDCCCAIPDINCTELAEKTCCNTMVMCNGKECFAAMKVFPGSYVWLSVAQADQGFHSDDEQYPHPKKAKTLCTTPQSQTAKDFLTSWDRETPYGVHSFMVDIKHLLDVYRQQIAPDGHQVVLRCGGTLLYTKEVCYVIIVTYVGDGIHDSFPPVTSPNTDDNREFPRLNWSPLLDDNGCYTGTKDGYPTFTPHHMKLYPFDNWDHVAFAIHLPEGKELSLPKDILVGGGPLETVHYTPDMWCHRFRKFGTDAAAKCKEAEQRYKDETHSTTSLQMCSAL